MSIYLCEICDVRCEANPISGERICEDCYSVFCEIEEAPSDSIMGMISNIRKMANEMSREVD